MKTPTPMVDVVAFTINRDVVVDIYPANEVVPAPFARGMEAALMEALRQIGELRAEKLQALEQQREILDTCIGLVQGPKFQA